VFYKVGYNLQYGYVVFAAKLGIMAGICMEVR